jgi:putative transferase (TIGR04331 family)
LEDPIYQNKTIQNNRINLDNINESLFTTKESQNIYLKMLNIFSKELNIIHDKKYPDKNWEILIGPWLKVSIDLFNNRWSIYNGIEDVNSYTYLIGNYDKSDFIPLDMNDFMQNKVYDHNWNNYLYSLFSFKKEKINLINSNKNKKEILSKNKSYKKNLLFDNFRLQVEKFNFRLSDNLVDGIYGDRSWKIIVKLMLRASSFNKIKNPSKKLISIDFSLRKLLLNKVKSNNNENEYCKLLNKFLCQNIPYRYLENYIDFSNTVSSSNKIKKPNFVMTSISHWMNDEFKVWLNNNLSAETTLTIFQHGGTYGITKHMSQHEFIERRICDNFISWGWQDNQSNKIIPGIMPKQLRQKYFKHKNNKPTILIIYPRLKMYSKGDPWDSISWNRKFISEQAVFLSLIKKDKYYKVICRMHPGQKVVGINFTKKLLTANNQILFDNNKNSLKSINQSTICIVTMNSTNLLECLKIRKPTIIFWDTSIVSFHKRSELVINNLINLGIMHSTAESAALKLIDLKNGIDHWWNSTEVQKALNDFTSMFCNSGYFRGLNSINKSTNRAYNG